MTKAVTLQNISLAYGDRPVLKNIDLIIKKGAYYGVVGPNGSGKTTLAYLMAGIITPDSGSIDTHGNRIGLVLANPENQIVSLVVEEDIAFGPENMNLPAPEIRRRIDRALAITRSTELRLALTSAISGGQMAKVVFAGQLAMDTDVLILDEGTAMLDPESRDMFLSTVRELNHAHDKTVIHISHRLDDLLAADTVLALVSGRIEHEAPGVIAFIRTCSSAIPGIEPGAQLSYRSFLAGLGIESASLEEATRRVADKLLKRDS
ncbi:MAG TPA: ATP-binding cassette domain-containing protein [Deltaproteobacteria bacterium]|nr:ATP-binding cassette domain-containing protein [Deltaproteobacteria bacterium]